MTRLSAFAIALCIVAGLLVWAGVKITERLDAHRLTAQCHSRTLAIMPARIKQQCKESMK